MKSGCIAKQISKCKKITSDFKTLFRVFVLSPDISEEMVYKSSVTSTKCSPKEEMFLSLENL